MSTAALEEITTEQVAKYLTENPTFFLKHEHLLADLYLPHASGEAVSLLERQVNILRERNIEMRKRANELLEQGQRNDVLFQKTRTLILNLLESRSLNDLSKRLVAYCEDEFQVDKVQFTLVGSPDAFRNSQTRVLSNTDIQQLMPGLISSADSVSGIFRNDELQMLFAGMQENIASAIVLPIHQDGKLAAILALGSNDPHYFKAGMDTLFLSFIGDVIARLLSRFS